MVLAVYRTAQPNRVYQFIRLIQRDFVNVEVLQVIGLPGLILDLCSIDGLEQIAVALEMTDSNHGV